MAIQQQSSGIEQLASKNGGGRARSGLTWRLLIFATVVLLVMVVSYIGLEFGYKNILMNQIDKVRAEAETLVAEVPEEQRGEVINYYSRLSNIQTLLNGHIYTSEFLSILEKNTDKGVYLSELSIDLEEEEVSLGGVARGYSELTRQMKAWQGVPGVSNISLESAVTREDGRVVFEIRFGINKKILEK